MVLPSMPIPKKKEFCTRVEYVPTVNHATNHMCFVSSVFSLPLIFSSSVVCLCLCVLSLTASKAALIPASKIPVPGHIFEDHFGESWEQVVEDDRALNAVEACEAWNITDAELNRLWQHATTTTKDGGSNKNNNTILKLGGGFYCAQIQPSSLVENHDKRNHHHHQQHHGKPYYVFNGFYPMMRKEYVESGATVTCMEITWDARRLSWRDFREHVIGSTDPSDAHGDSLRGLLVQRYDRLGISKPLSKGNNGIHGSAGPFEGLVERTNWFRRRHLHDDEAYGKYLLRAGLAPELLSIWSKDPQIHLDDTNDMVGSLFDALEGLDAGECLEEMVRLSRFQT